MRHAMIRSMKRVKEIIQLPKSIKPDGRRNNGGRRKGAGRRPGRPSAVPGAELECDQNDGILDFDLLHYGTEIEKAPIPEPIPEPIHEPIPEPHPTVDNPPTVEKEDGPATKPDTAVVILTPVDSSGDGSFIPTEADRVIVQHLSGLLLVSEIAALLRDGVSPETVVRHFQPELRRGRSRRIADVAAVLYNRAMDLTDKFSGPAAMFYLRARGGWNDTQKIEIAGKVDVDHVHGLAASGWGPIEIKSFEDTGVIPDGRHIPE